MSWWVCRVCKTDDACCGQWVDGPCFVYRRKEPDHCVDALWVKDWAEWRPATPKDLAEIAKSLFEPVPPPDAREVHTVDHRPRLTAKEFAKLECMAQEIAESEKRRLKLREKLELDEETDEGNYAEIVALSDQDRSDIHQFAIKRSKEMQEEPDDDC